MLINWALIAPIAVIEWSQIVPLIIGIFGVAGIIFTALKYNRDDTTAIVNQQSIILSNMKSLNDELRITTASLREERDQLRAQVGNLTGQVEALRGELQEARNHLSSKVTSIERKLDDGSN